MKLNHTSKVLFVLLSAACIPSKNPPSADSGAVSSSNNPSGPVEISCSTEDVRTFVNIRLASPSAGQATIKLTVGEITPRTVTAKAVVSQQEEFMNYNLKMEGGDFINAFIDETGKGEGPAQINGQLVLLKCGVVKDTAAQPSDPSIGSESAMIRCSSRDVFTFVTLNLSHGKYPVGTNEESITIKQGDIAALPQRATVTSRASVVNGQWDYKIQTASSSAQIDMDPKTGKGAGYVEVGNRGSRIELSCGFAPQS